MSVEAWGRGSRWCAALLLAGCAVLACEGEVREAAAKDPSDATERQEMVLGRIDGEPILVADVRALLRGRDVDTPEGRRAAVEGVIVRRLAAAEARREGLAEDPRIRAELQAIEREARARQEALLRDALFARLRDGLALSEAELRAHYEKTRSRYLERQLRLRRQTFPDRAAAEAADVALGAEGRLDPAAGELLGPAPLRELPREVLPDVLQLERPGERVVVVHEGGAALVELVEVLPAEPLPFEAARERVEASLRTLRGQERMRARLAELRAAAEVEIDGAALADDSLWKGAEARSAKR